MKSFVFTFLLIFSSCFIQPLFAQCGTVVDTAFFELLKNRSLTNYRTEAVDTVVYVPIKIHIVRKTDGSGGVSLDEVMKGITATDTYFSKIKIKFVICGAIDYINVSAFDTISKTNEDQVALTRDVANVCNIYYTNIVKSGGKIYAGYAYFPGGPQRIIMSNSSASDNTVLPHEMGHFFGLPHTFSNSNATDVSKRELVTRGTGANCQTAGDYICDTPADPFVDGISSSYLTDCKYNGTNRDANNALYAPMINNLMSYYWSCTDEVLTAGQYEVMLAARNGANRSILTCNQPSVVAPSNLTATLSKMGILLNWKDNASNELGYFVEMSTTANGIFQTIAQLPANSSTYSYANLGSNVSYYFRIRPYNASKEVSNIATYTTGKAYCIPVHEKNCTESSPYFYALNKVTISGENILENATGCSTDNYTIFTNKSVTLFAGSTYKMVLAIKSNDDGSYSGDSHAWLDLNGNAIFDDPAERLERTINYSNASTFLLKIPASTSLGAKRLRIRILQNSSIYYNRTDLACIPAEYGIAEDYEVQIATRPTTFAVSLNAVLEKNYRTVLSWTFTGLSSDTKCLLERSKTADGVYDFLDTVRINTKKMIDGNVANGSYFYRLRRFDTNALISNVANVTISNYKKPFVLKAVYTGNVTKLTWQGDTTLFKKIIVKSASYNYQYSYYGSDTVKSYLGSFVDFIISRYNVDQFYKLYDTEGIVISNYDSIRVTPYCIPRFKKGECKTGVSYLTISKKETADIKKYHYSYCSEQSKFEEPYNVKDTLKAGKTYTFSSASSYGCFYNIQPAVQPTYNMAVWLDANFDNQFAASELLYANKADNNPCLRSFDYTLPQNAVSGYTRIRFIATEISEFAKTACDSFNTGHATDFLVYISGVPLGMDAEEAETGATFLYPNPSKNGTFTIQSTLSVEKIQVYNALGNKVTETQDIKVENIASGFYLVKVQLSNGKEWTGKLLVE